jgi:hypothetical protein
MLELNCSNTKSPLLLPNINSARHFLVLLVASFSFLFSSSAVLGKTCTDSPKIENARKNFAQPWFVRNDDQCKKNCIADKNCIGYLHYQDGKYGYLCHKLTTSKGNSVTASDYSKYSSAKLASCSDAICTGAFGGEVMCKCRIRKADDLFGATGAVTVCADTESFCGLCKGGFEDCSKACRGTESYDLSEGRCKYDDGSGFWVTWSSFNATKLNKCKTTR